MAILDNHRLRQQAADNLNAAPNQKKLVLVFVCATVVLSLLIGIINVILDSQIAGTGGLGGLQMRSTLTTVQSLLNIALLVFVPFWNLGYTSVALKLGRGEAASEQDLLNGFRRFGPGLRLMLLRLVIYFAVMFVAVQVGSILFSMTPWADPFYQQLETVNLGSTGRMDEATLMALIPAMIPFWIIVGTLSIVAFIPVTYRLRMAEFRLMDDPKCGALVALLLSNRMMKGNCVKLFKLDLHFWWFYLAISLIPLLCYGDVLLPMMGVNLPFDPMVSFFLFYVASQAAQVLLYWRYRNLLECTYVGAYDTLNAEQVLPSPWNN